MKLTPHWFLTSDTHFDHSKLVNLGMGRPGNFSELIVENWNKVVGKKDFVLHLGDLTMTNKEKTKSYTQRLNGQKFLIRGNHDGASDTWYQECGFTVVEPIFKIFKDKYDNWHKFLFTHVPVAPLPDEFFNVHGHLHGNSHRGNVPNGYQYFDVGVDCTNFTPIRLYEVFQKLLVDKPTS